MLPLFRVGLAGALCLLGISSQAGAAVVVITEAGEVDRIDPDTGASTPLANVPPQLNRQIAADASGGAFVRTPTGAVLRVDLASGVVTPLAEGGFLNTSFASGIAADGTDAIATSSIEVEGVERTAVVRIDPGGGQDLVADVPSGASAVAVEADGSILVLYLQQILRVDPATGDSEPVTSGDLLDAPRDIDVLPDGTIAVLHLDPAKGIALVDPVTGVQSLPAAATGQQGQIELNRITGFASDAEGTFYLTTGHGNFANEAFPGGLVSFVPGGLARAVTGPSEFYAPFDVAVPEPGAALLLAAGASLLLFLRVARGWRG